MDKYRNKHTGEIIEVVCLDEEFMLGKTPTVSWIGEAYKKYNPIPIRSNDGRVFALSDMSEHKYGELYFRKFILEGRAKIGEVSYVSIGELTLHWDKINEAIAKDDEPDQTHGIKANEMASKIADTMNQRAQDRGEKEERSMARTVAMFNALKGQNLMSEHDGWRFMEILKMVRSEIGSKFVLDDYIDGGAYCFLAGECRSQQSTTEQQ